MNLATKIKEELKKTLGMLLADNTQPQLQISDMVVGGKVEIINPDGTLSPAPNGEYTVDKDAIEVKDGQITSVNGVEEKAPTDNKTPEEKLADTPVDNSSTDLKAQVDALKVETTDLKAAIEELKNSIATDKAEDDAEDKKMSAHLSKQFNDLNETLKFLANLPGEFSKTNQSPIEKDVKESKILTASTLWANRK